MLSLEHQTVYDIIRDVAGEEEVYKVIEADEVLERMPKAIPMSKVQLSAIIRDLRDMEYLTVKYFTTDEYCMLVTKRIEDFQKRSQKANDVEETTAPAVSAEEKIENRKIKQVSGAKIFFVSFLGSFFAGIIVAVIAVIISKYI